MPKNGLMSKWLVWDCCKHSRRLANISEHRECAIHGRGVQDVRAPNHDRDRIGPISRAGMPLTKSHEEALVAVATVGV